MKGRNIATGDYWPNPGFLEEVADKVHALFFPPAPTANRERFEQMVSVAIRQQNQHAAADAESDRKAADHYVKIKQDRRLRNEEVGPPEKGWLWVKGFRADLEAEPLDAWVPPELAGGLGLARDEPIPTWGGLQPTPPEIILPGQYVILAILHDNTDAATNRGRPRLLDGFALPLAFATMRNRGPGTQSGIQVSGFDRPSIERALADVGADLQAGAERARQERKEKAGARKPAKPKSSWELDTKRQRARVRNRWYDLSDAQTQALSVLTHNKGAWVSGEKCSARMDKLVKRMPDAVRALVETKKGPGLGYRLKPDLFTK